VKNLVVLPDSIIEQHNKPIEEAPTPQNNQGFPPGMPPDMLQRIVQH
jgi:hypothetical protein